MGFLRQECWSESLLPSLRDFPDPGIKAMFPALPGSFFTTESQGKTLVSNYVLLNIHTHTKVMLN